MSSEIIVSLLSSMVGGLLVAIVNHFFTRKKSEAEIEKLRAETIKTNAEAEKIGVETARLVSEVSKLNSAVEEVAARTIDFGKTIFDARKTIDILDFEGMAYFINTDPEKVSAKCNLSVKQNILVLDRLNTGGLYAVNLRRYTYKDKIQLYLPRDEALSRKRVLKFACEVRVNSGSCTLEFAFYDNDTDTNLDRFITTVAQTDWSFVSRSFSIPSDSDCYLQFRYYASSTQPQSLMIRNIYLADFSA